MFKLNFLRIFMFDLFHHDPNRSLWSCDESVEKKVVESVFRASESWLYQSSKKTDFDDDLT